MKAPLRKVTAHAYVGACQYTSNVPRTIRLTLECGHESFRKASAGVPKRARCKDCVRTEYPKEQS